MNIICRKTLVLVGILLIVPSTFAQYNADYIEMRNDGCSLMSSGKYSDALKMFEGASGFATSTNQKNELNKLKRQVRDSVSTIYDRAVKLAKNASSKQNYGDALQTFKLLLPIEGLDVNNVYSWMGYCYEHLSEPYAAISQFEKGLALKESLSAKRLAQLLPKYRNISTDSIVGLYKIAAISDKTAYDSIGDIYAKSHPYKAFDSYKLSKTQYGRYQMASLMLCKKITNNMSPVTILKELSNEKYAPAQFYLGLLYFQGSEWTTQDEKNGLNLIQSASDNGLSDAKQWLKERKEELNRLKYSY